MTDEARLDALLDEIRTEFAGFRLVPKERSPLQRAIDRALRVVTFGAQRSYLDAYVTTIGRTVYVNRGWEERSAADRYVTLRHERVHLRQFRRLGLLPMALLYLLVPFPLGLAWFRAHFEREAYAEGLRAMRETYGPGYVARPEVREHVLAQFTGPSYGWMWPFRRSIERWYDRVTAPVENDVLG